MTTAVATRPPSRDPSAHLRARPIDRSVGRLTPEHGPQFRHPSAGSILPRCPSPPPSTSCRSPPIASRTSRRCSRRAATRNGAGAPTFDPRSRLDQLDGGRESRRARRPDRTRTCAPGLVAYRDDRPSAGSASAPREDYERLAYSKILAPLDDVPVWSIVCFVVSRRDRGPGRAPRRSSTPAIEYARRHGATDPRGLPGRRPEGRTHPGGERLPRHAPDVRTGRVQVVERRQWNATTPRPADRPAAPSSASSAATRRARLRHLSVIRHRRLSGLTSVSHGA